MFPGFWGTKRQQNLLQLYIIRKDANYINKPSRQTTSTTFQSNVVSGMNNVVLGSEITKFPLRKNLKIEDENAFSKNF